MQQKNCEDRHFLQKKSHIPVEQTIFCTFVKKKKKFIDTHSLYSVQRKVTIDFINFSQKSSLFAGLKLTYLLKIDMNS